jgi:hypothetical protein
LIAELLEVSGNVQTRFWCGIRRPDQHETIARGDRENAEKRFGEVGSIGNFIFGSKKKESLLREEA